MSNNFAYFDKSTECLVRFSGASVNFWADYGKLYRCKQLLECYTYDVETGERHWHKFNVTSSDDIRKTKELYVLHFKTDIDDREFRITFTGGAILSAAIGGTDWEPKTVEMLYSELSKRKGVWSGSSDYRDSYGTADNNWIPHSGSITTIIINSSDIKIRAIDLRMVNTFNDLFLAGIAKITKDEYMSEKDKCWLPYDGDEVWGIKILSHKSKDYNIVVRGVGDIVNIGVLCSISSVEIV